MFCVSVFCAGINGICVHNIIRMKCADRSTNDEESIDRNERDKHQTSQVVHRERHMGNGQNVLAKQYRAVLIFVFDEPPRTAHSWSIYTYTPFGGGGAINDMNHARGVFVRRRARSRSALAFRVFLELRELGVISRWLYKTTSSTYYNTFITLIICLRLCARAQLGVFVRRG